MSSTGFKGFIIGPDDRILVTGANGFIGRRVVRAVLDLGFRNVRCLARPTSNIGKLELHGGRQQVEITRGNLLSREDCDAATKDVAVILHLAAGRGEKSFPDAFLNSVVATRNLLDAVRSHGCLRRIVNVSSFTVYDNARKPSGNPQDESCPIEQRPEQRSEAYCFAKVRQDELVAEYGRNFAIPYVIVRPGFVYGAGNEAITGRVGVGTFGVFLHFGGSNTIPLTYVENCAEAIALAGVTLGIDGETFNVVDDDLPSSREFLRRYKREVKRFPSIYIPHMASYLLCSLWEWYSKWSEEQLPPAFNRSRWYANWKKTSYSNEKLKRRLGWTPSVPTDQGLGRYFEACRQSLSRA